MNRYIISSITLCLLTITAAAQQPKWFKKAKKAQISIETFDHEGKKLNAGQGFFVEENGIAVANYSLFKGAHRAIVTDIEGNQFPVSSIMGANSLYDVIRFRTDIGKYKIAPLTLAKEHAAEQETCYVLPNPEKEKGRCLMTTITEKQTFKDNYPYYTLSVSLDSIYTNSPIANEQGEIIGMVQAFANKENPESYAISVAFAYRLSTNSRSVIDNDLNQIHIRKSIPADESDARTFIYLLANQSDSINYEAAIQEFAISFPESPDAYTLRMEFYASHGNYSKTEEIYHEAMLVCEKKDEIAYSFSKLLYSLSLRNNPSFYKDWNLEKALKQICEAYAFHPLPLYQQQEGHILYALKRYDEAFEKYMQLKETNMRSSQLFLYAAQCKRMAGAKPEEIINLLDSAVNCHKEPYPIEVTEILLERANYLAEAGKYKEAVRDMHTYEKYANRPLTALFYYKREQLEMQCRMYQQAIDDIDRALRLAPDEPLFHAERSVVYYTIGEFEEALRSAQESKRLKPDFADAYKMAGICLLRLERKEEAMEHLKKAKDLGDESVLELLNNDT